MNREVIAQVAEKYASAGMVAIPTHTMLPDGSCTCNKGSQCESAGKHPIKRDWQKTDKPDPDFWRKLTHDRYGIGIVCGRASNLIVVDCDTPEAVEFMDSLADEIILVDKTTHGKHYYYAWRSDILSSNNIGQVVGIPGIDIKSSGGYVNAPPDEGYEFINPEYLDYPRQPIPQHIAAIYALAKDESNPHSIPEGARNDALARYAWKLRSFKNDVITDILNLINRNRCQPPLPQSEVETIIKQMAKKLGKRYVASVPVEITNERPRVSFQVMTEQATANQFVELYKDKFRFAPGLGWLVWDSVRWKPDLGKGEISETYRQFVSDLVEEAALDGNAPLEKWAYSLQSLMKRNHVLELASTDKRYIVDINDFDADPWMITTRDGYMQLRHPWTWTPKGEGRPLTMRCMNVELMAEGHPWNVPENFEPAQPIDPKTNFIHVEPCEKIDHFLEFITNGDPGYFEYLLQYAAYCLTGGTGEKVIAVQYGPMDTLKTTFVLLLADMMGDYARSISTEMFLDTFGYGEDARRQELAEFPGVRFAYASEPDPGKHFATGRLKKLTSHEPVTAKRVYKPPFTYTPQFKLILGTNEMPVLRELGRAFANRLHVLPFTHQMPRADQRPVEDFLDHVREEYPRFLAQIIYAQWRRLNNGNKFVLPEVVENATNRAFEEDEYEINL